MKDKEIINKFIQLCIEEEKSIYEANHKVGNKIYNEFQKIYKLFEKNKPLAIKILSKLIKNDIVNVRFWASTQSLKLGINIDDSEKVLKKISFMDDIGVIALNAEMTLKAWNEGNL